MCFLSHFNISGSFCFKVHGCNYLDVGFALSSPWLFLPLCWLAELLRWRQRWGSCLRVLLVPGFLKSQSLSKHPVFSEVGSRSSYWRPSLRVTHAAQIPDPLCVPLQRSGLCWGLCTVVPKSPLELPGTSSYAEWWDPASWDQFLQHQGLVTPELSLSKWDSRCNGVGACRLSPALWLWQLSVWLWRQLIFWGESDP